MERGKFNKGVNNYAFFWQKWGFVLFIAVLLLACKKDNEREHGGDFVTKVRIKDASLLFKTDYAIANGAQLVMSNFAGGQDTGLKDILYKQTNEGAVEPVYFIKENGDSITMEIQGLRALSEDFVLIGGNFRLKEDTYSDILVDVRTEAIYGFPLKWYELANTTVEIDASGSIYFLYGKTMVYKLNTADLNNIQIEEYLPQNQRPDFFMVNPAGICFYRSEGNSRDLKFKLPSGEIMPLSTVFGMESNYATFFQVFYGFNGDYYAPRIEQPGGEYQLHKIHFSNDGPESTHIMTWQDALVFHKNHVRKSFFSFIYGGVLLEIDEATEAQKSYPSPYRPNTVYDQNRMGSTKNYYIMPAPKDNLITKVSLQDYRSEHTIVLPKNEFEISEFMFNDKSETISFTGLRYADGKNIVGTIGTDGNVSFEVVDSGRPVSLVKLN